MADLDLAGMIFLYSWIIRHTGINTSQDSLNVAVATSILSAAPLSYKVRKRQELEYEMLVSHLVKSCSFPSMRDWAILMRSNHLEIGADQVWFSQVLSACQHHKYPGYTYSPRLGGATFNSVSAKLRRAVKTLFSYDGANRRERFCAHMITLAKRLARDCFKYAEEVAAVTTFEQGKSLTIHGPIGTGLAGCPIVWSATEMSILEPDYLAEQLRDLGGYFDSFALQFPSVRQIFRDNGITNMAFPTINFLAAGDFDHNYVKGFPSVYTSGLRSIRSQGTFGEFTKNGVLILSDYMVRGWGQLREKFEVCLSEYKQSGFVFSLLPH